VDRAGRVFRLRRIVVLPRFVVVRESERRDGRFILRSEIRKGERTAATLRMSSPAALCDQKIVCQHRRCHLRGIAKRSQAFFSEAPVDQLEQVLDQMDELLIGFLEWYET